MTELIELVGAVDGILQAQANENAAYFARVCGRKVSEREAALLEDVVLKAYRWQYIISGVQAPRFNRALGTLIDSAQVERIGAARTPIVQHVGAPFERLEALAS